MADDYDTLVPDRVVWRELGVSAMTGWRWTRDPDIHFPAQIKIRGRNYRSRAALQKWKESMMRRAITQRDQRPAPAHPPLTNK